MPIFSVHSLRLALCATASLINIRPENKPLHPLYAIQAKILPHAIQLWTTNSASDSESKSSSRIDKNVIEPKLMWEPVHLKQFDLCCSSLLSNFQTKPGWNRMPSLYHRFWHYCTFCGSHCANVIMTIIIIIIATVRWKRRSWCSLAELKWVILALALGTTSVKRVSSERIPEEGSGSCGSLLQL